MSEWSNDEQRQYQRFLLTMNQHTWEPSEELDEDGVVPIRAYNEVVAKLAHDELELRGILADQEVTARLANRYRGPFLGATIGAAFWALVALWGWMR